jgi:hypothetical protein
MSMQLRSLECVDVTEMIKDKSLPVSGYQVKEEILIA